MTTFSTLLVVAGALSATEPADRVISISPSDSLHEAVAQEADALNEDGARCRIVLAPGEYFVEETVALGSTHSGLTIEAAEPDTAVLYGGRMISDWQDDGDGLVAADLPGVKEGTWDFRALVINGRMPRRARLPETGSFEHLSVFDVPWMSTTGGGWKRKPTEQELTTLVYKPEDLGDWLSVANAELTVYHMWDETMVGLKAHEPAAHTLTFSNPSEHPAGAFNVNKYVVWNVREGMKQPGQWYLDRERGKVVYWPLPGEDMAQAKVIAPTTTVILRVSGTDQEPAHGIAFRNLTLAVTNTPLIAGGFGAGKFEGALTIGRAENCRVERLHIFNVAGQGMTVNARGSEVVGNHVHNTGACGIKFHAPTGLVDNNHVHDVGVMYPSAIGIWGGGKGADSGVRISHNEVHDTPYTAIVCGGENAVISDNLIYRAMKELHDGAGIYIGFCKGITLRGNIIRDIVDTGGYGASAYYLDEQAENCVVEKNLAVNVARPSHNHMARNNTLRNNVFIVDGDATLTFQKSEGYALERNVICATGGVKFTNRDAIASWSGNVIYSGSGMIEGSAMDGYQVTGTTALDVPGVRAGDPLIQGIDEKLITFADGSPAAELGIQPLDLRDAGRLSR